MMKTEWRGFKGNQWQSEVNLRDFVQNNYTSYDGDESFLAEPTQATNTLWGMLKELQKEERAKGGVLDMETEVVSGLTAYGAAYIGEGTKELEKVVGLQTDKPLKCLHALRWYQDGRAGLYYIRLSAIREVARDFPQVLQNS